MTASHAADSGADSCTRLPCVQGAGKARIASLANAAISALILSGCIDERPIDIGAKAPYKTWVGQRCEVVGNVNAYAVVDYAKDKSRALFVELMPPPGVTGRYISYVVPVAQGTIFSVRRVLQSDQIGDRWIILVGALSEASIAKGADVRLTLSPSNRDEAGKPRSDLYRCQP